MAKASFANVAASTCLPKATKCSATWSAAMASGCPMPLTFASFNLAIRKSSANETFTNIDEGSSSCGPVATFLCEGGGGTAAAEAGATAGVGAFAGTVAATAAFACADPLDACLRPAAAAALAAATAEDGTDCLTGAAQAAAGTSGALHACGCPAASGGVSAGSASAGVAEADERMGGCAAEGRGWGCDSSGRLRTSLTTDTS
mmetsp:Transcript_146550/g.365448  ORF Transcript_146550/g.365448 Transcript_146550/m.365448 type:complete len:203 (-) Transcript_146550:2945-3553(-)